MTSGQVASIVVSPRAAAPRVDGRRDAVRGEDERAADGHVVLALDEDRAALLELADDVEVVNDLLADVDGCPVQVEGLLDSFDGTLDAGAESAGRGEEYSLDQTGHDGSWAAPTARR